MVTLDRVCEVGPRMLKRLFCGLCFVMLVSQLNAVDDVALNRALTKIVGDDVLQANLRHVLQHDLSLAEPDRFEALSDAVLPSDGRSEIRLSCEYDSDHQFLTNTFTTIPGDSPSGGFLISPALHRVELAARMNRLDDLLARVQAIEASGEVHERCRLALMTLIEIRRGDFVEAARWMTSLEERHAKETFPRFPDRWPETLVLTVAVQHVELQEIAESMLTRTLTEQIRKGHHCGPVQWDRQMAALLGTLRLHRQMHSTKKESPDVDRLPMSPDWIPVAGCDEATRALAMPALHWQRTGNQYEKVNAHQDDYLLYRSPLRGNFTVECDVSCFDYREMQLTIGGHWFSPHYTHDTLETGTLRGMTAQAPLKPKLSLVGDWSRHRAVMHDGQRHSYFNGRLLQTEPVRQHQFPWVAFRSPYFANGRVRNVHITGSPEIPQTISLSSDPDLSGWVRFHLDNIGGVEPDWDYEKPAGYPGEIVALRKTRFQDTFQESLLRYFRPMAEDGVMEYEFFYSPNTVHVHPALDQMVYLIEPDQVSLHQATNGIHDASGLDPLNRVAVSPPVACPLVLGWNQLKLEVIGDLVQIVLNRTKVYQGKISAGNDRTFGLFHYADQTDVRVRNMQWTGNWPRVLPPIAEQELRNQELDDLEAQSETLTNRLDMDFVSEPGKPASSTYSDKTFQFHTSDQRGTATLNASGLEMTRPGTAAFSDVWVTPRIRVTGDFDIEATFENLQLATPTNGTNAISLIVVTEDEQTTHSRVWHGAYAHPNIELRHATQAEFNRYGKGRDVSIEFQGVTSEDCTSGRLRVVRLGQRMSFMIAEQDSQFYRVIHEADVTDASVRFDGIRLGAGIWGHPNADSESVSVLWKRLTIRTQQDGTERLGR